MQCHRRSLSFLWQAVLALGLSAGLLLHPGIAFAAANADRAIDRLGCNLIPALESSETSKRLVAIAITILNVGALLGKISWGVALLAALGITLAFSAATIVSAEGISSRDNACLITAAWPNR